MSTQFGTDFPAVAFVARTEEGVRERIAVAVEAASTPEMIQVDSVEAAAILGVTANNLRQIVHKKQLLQAGKRGGRAMFNREDVQALADRRSVSIKRLRLEGWKATAMSSGVTRTVNSHMPVGGLGRETPQGEGLTRHDVL